MTPAEALERLLEGNERFREGRPLDRPLQARLEAAALGQSPFALVLGCIDSRAPVETVLDQGIGDIFSVRVAGNVVGPNVLGSMEFACKLAGAKAIVVMGHTDCGAVRGSIAKVELGHVTEVTRKIAQAVEDARAELSPEDAGFVDRVAELNVGYTVAAIRDRSDVLRAMEDDGEIALAGAMYDVVTGELRFLDR